MTARVVKGPAFDPASFLNFDRYLDRTASGNVPCPGVTCEGIRPQTKDAEPWCSCDAGLAASRDYHTRQALCGMQAKAMRLDLDMAALRNPATAVIRADG